MAKKRGFARFVQEDHRYVFLGTSAIACVGLALANQPHSPSSFLLRSYAVESILYYVLLAWLAVSAVALVNKLAKWKGTAYAETSPFTKPEAKKAERIGSYIVWAIVGIFFVDRGIIGLSDLLSSSISSDSNPTDFLASMFYMLYQMRDTFIQGILGTIEIAVIGTVVAFFLALGLVFLRLMEIDRSDNDFVRFWKVVGVGFAKVYSAVMRGTPMMIQGLIIYYAGTGLLTGQGMTPTQILSVWSPFNAGLVTVSLNSTAYMMEVLRGGIQAIDRGQTEAARSLGMSNWQSMIKVVFPQAVKNSIPAIGNEFIINIKDSSVLSVIGVMDLMYATKSVSGIYFRSLEIYCVAAILYLILTWLSSKLLQYLGKKLDTPVKGIPSSN